MKSPMLRLGLGFAPFLLLLAAPFPSPAQDAPPGEPAPLDWPAITHLHRPWTRWWWQGSAVDDANLSASLEAYRAVGLGGVEITPIYGVAGSEDRFIDYLSPAWVARLEHTLREAERLGLGVDMATGTGWPFGGPTVAAGDAARYVAYETYELRGGERLEEPLGQLQDPLVRAIGNRTPIPAGPAPHPLRQAGRDRVDLGDLVEPIAANEHLQALALEQVRFPEPMPLAAVVAYSDAGDVQVVTDRVDGDGRLRWTAPEGDWTLYAVFVGWHGKMVERAAPGGEGWALDHFSDVAVESYLAHFSDALAAHDVGGLRAFFNDSYEVDDAQGEADWTPGFFQAFLDRRGYDLREHLPALFGDEPADTARRVLTDYRETVSDLLLDHFTARWAAWADARGALVRNQAHGSPGNVLDLYAAADIPETEGSDLLRFKLATSAAHVTGRPLASAEAATWLDDHFLSSLADVKEAVDGYFLGGVNHIVYHGTAYSPENEPWPGWLFYAAVHFSPTNPFWTDFGALNEYVARSQSILQHGRPDNDVLLYLPIFDRWAEGGGSLLVHIDGMGPFQGMTVAEDATFLRDRGYAFDFVSDRQLRGARANDGGVRTAGGSEPAGHPGYRVVVVPGVELMPLGTLESLVGLVEVGATVAFHRGLPDSVPGLGSLEARQAAFREALGRLDFGDADSTGVRSASHGTGRALLSDDLDALLSRAGVGREPMVAAGLRFVRRRRADGVDWFVANRGDSPVDGWVPLGRGIAAAALFDPMTGETGVAKVRATTPEDAEVYLQLRPGESIIVRGHDNGIQGPTFGYFERAGAPRVLAGPWRVEFVEGGPTVPTAIDAGRLESWTLLGDAAAREFAGAATYSVTFPRPELDAEHWRLDLGDVRESARVSLNGTPLATLTGPSFETVFSADLLRDDNVLQVTVSNLMANRIAAMDRRGEPWKRFYNVNFPANRRENVGESGLFDASDWDPLPSGLLGPVTLTPLDPL